MAGIHQLAWAARKSVNGTQKHSQDILIISNVSLYAVTQCVFAFNYHIQKQNVSGTSHKAYIPTVHTFTATIP
jgi:hypothetical protein